MYLLSMTRKETITMTTATTPRLLGYVRVSTDEQALEGVSLDAQRHRLGLYAELQGAQLVDVLGDEGISGKRADNRPALQEALRRLKAGEADGLVVLKLDRLSRSTRDVLELVDLSGRQGWALHSISEKLDTGSAAGRFVLTILAGLAQMEREQISERTTFALAHMRANGLKTGGDLPFGFRLAEDGRSLEQHPEEQEVVACVRELVAEGQSMRKVAEELNRRGILTKKGKAWTHVQVGSVLRASA